MNLQSTTIGVLSFHGDVREHIRATEIAGEKLSKQINIVGVRSSADLDVIDALIIPGGESTTLYKLCDREGMWEKIKRIRFIFGTCAGAIMLAKNVLNRTKDQKTLELMDVAIDRNAYGRQTESFEKKIDSKMGVVDAVFIRAPKIRQIGENVRILARDGKEIVACEQNTGSNYYLVTCFHPELTTELFHKYFLRKIIEGDYR